MLADVTACGGRGGARDPWGGARAPLIEIPVKNADQERSLTTKTNHDSYHEGHEEREVHEWRGSKH